MKTMDPSHAVARKSGRSPARTKTAPDNEKEPAAMQTPSKWPGRIKLLAILVIVAALLVTMRQLPIDRAVEALKVFIGGLGWVGPLVFALIYIVATVLLAPGSPLTLAAAPVFGLWIGFLAVSVGSTIGASLAFLIARYLARDRVRAMAENNPRFQAIDGAIAEGGWKIVALLRLSPAIPFNLQNYLYGLTPIKFWHYVLTSWIFMMPGTFMYVYLGYAASQGLQAAAGGGGKSPGEWALLGVGLVATIAVTVYVTKLANKALKQQTDLDAASPKENDDTAEPVKSGVSGAAVLALLAVVMCGVAGFAMQHKERLRGLFGPPEKDLIEAYTENSGGPGFDHGAFDALLKAHVDDDGYVDYAALKADAETLDGYIARLGEADFDALGRDEKLALLINAYNAFTLRLILDHYPLASIKDIPAAERWDAVRWKVGPQTWSLNQIEHEQIRPKFREPRIHFALVCAAIGCPKLRNEAFVASRLEEQLADQTAYVHAHERWLRFAPGDKSVQLTKLYHWYGGDFEQVADGSVLRFVAKHAPAVHAALEAGAALQVTYLPYDWTLNDKKNTDR